MGRPRLPEGQARTVNLQLWVTPGAYERFAAAAKARGLTPTQAHRQALALWTAGGPGGGVTTPRGGPAHPQGSFPKAINGDGAQFSRDCSKAAFHRDGRYCRACAGSRL